MCIRGNSMLDNFPIWKKHFSNKKPNESNDLGMNGGRDEYENLSTFLLETDC